MPAEYIFDITPLATGQPAPFTGNYVSMARTSTHTITSYFTGTLGSIVNLYYPTPFTSGTAGFVPNPDVFLTGIAMNLSGYQPPVAILGAYAGLKAVCSGTGNFWVALARRS